MGRLELHYRALEGDVEGILARIAAGDSVGTPHYAGFTPLHLAAQQSQSAAAAALIDAGAPIDARTSSETRPCSELYSTRADKATPSRPSSVPEQTRTYPTTRESPQERSPRRSPTTTSRSSSRLNPGTSDRAHLLRAAGAERSACRPSCPEPVKPGPPDLRHRQDESPDTLVQLRKHSPWIDRRLL